jgi:NAD(P)-dependent dehydrogenase (short-subunit alcohol dehydrogenase family)
MTAPDDASPHAPAGAKRLDGKIALVTGASRGLGRAAALALAREGAHVIICGRTSGALEDLDDEIRQAGGASTILVLDLRKFDKLDQLGPTLYQRWQHLDIFVANAAILGTLSPLPHTTADTWTSVIDINLNANWRLIRTLDPLLRNAPAGRAIFVSSRAASTTPAYWGPYAVSKAALEALASTYAEECANSPVRVVSLDPGAMRTGMRQKAFPGEDPMTLPSPEEVAPLVVELALPSSTFNGTVVRYRTWARGRHNAANDVGTGSAGSTPD